MLETMDNMTLCGVISWNNNWECIYADETGALLMETYADDSCWYITEVNIGKPLALDNTGDLQRNIDSGLYGDEVIGVAYGYDGNIVVFLDENMAVERKLWEPKVDVGARFYYSTDEQFEGEDYTD